MKKVALHNLGCKVNAYETEGMQQMLEQAGYEIVPFHERADVYVINTCSVTNMADRKSRQMLHKAKKTNPEAIVIAAGCYVQTKEDEAALDESIDIVIGNNKKHMLLDAIEAYEKKRQGNETEKVNEVVDINHVKQDYEELHLEKTAEHTRAFLKVQDGCNQFCSYCIIPYLRGPYRSVPMEQLLAEARELADNGVRELILVAQETTLYGKDLYGEKTLPKLLHELAQIPGIYWIRIQYCYPEEITDELIQTIKTEEKVCHYLDIPIQHINDDILRRMNRRGNGEYVKELFAKLRREIPGLVLRTSLITGLPGEGEAEFAQLCDFLKEYKLERVGAFAFSPEEGTRAAEMEYPDTEIARQRADMVAEIQSRIMDDYNESCIGKTMQVLCEGYDPDEESYYGRTFADSPDIDGKIWFTAEKHIKTGDFADVRVVDAYDGELVGVLEEEYNDDCE